jgi:dTDP-4-dehydrorhamnose reductase
MRILVTGYSGQLGYDVVKEGLSRGLEMVGVGSKDLDITDELAVDHFIDRVKPDGIIHCAAYTAVDKAEENKEECWRVNVLGSKNLAEAGKKVDSKFIYISTDYVFDGAGDTPFNENDKANPINYYGYSKHEGEKVIKSLITKSFIVRISWVFGMNGNNFVKTMLRLAETNTDIKVVNDQFGSPTYTPDLSRLLLDMIQTDEYGTYHATNEGFCSWADFANEIFKQTNKNVRVNAIKTEDYPTKAKRPKNSRLNKENINDSGFNPLPRWEDSLSHYLKQLNEVD